MKKVGIVILNYLNYEDTIRCVESSRKLNYKNIVRVIVENGSYNQSRKILNDKYKNDDSITLLISNKNLGYAKGNNLGILFCRKYKKCDFVLILNNDTFIEQEDFIEKLLEYDTSIPIGAVGPRIISGNNKENNPIFVRADLRRIIKDLVINITIILRLYKIIKNFVKQSNMSSVNTSRINNNKNPFILHGAALMLTPEYFKYFNGLYCGTFLYYEEIILGVLFKKTSLKFFFQTSAYIIHEEDGSSRISNNNSEIINAKRHIGSIFRAMILNCISHKNIRKKINNGLIELEKQYNDVWKRLNKNESQL